MERPEPVGSDTGGFDPLISEALIVCKPSAVRDWTDVRILPVSEAIVGPVRIETVSVLGNSVDSRPSLPLRGAPLTPILPLRLEYEGPVCMLSSREISVDVPETPILDKEAVARSVIVIIGCNVIEFEPEGFIDGV